jgi:cell division septation protein DedD
MARYFEEDEEREFEEPRQDTELTLGWGTLLGLGLGLLVVCVLCFGLGYMVGHSGRSSSAPPATTASQQNAPDQEPLQGSESVPKPSATAQAPVPPPAQTSANTPDAAQSGGSPEAAPSPAQSVPPAAAPASAAPAQPQVRPAFGANRQENPQSSAAPNVRPALPSANSLMVQVAAVKNDEDASVLTNALRRRGYPVISHRDPGDGLIHVRIGPFPTRDEANQWRLKLLNDGYNAIVEP